MIRHWNDERLAALERLWNEGVPGATIAIRLGVTRHAVIAKAHRLGLPSRRPSPRQAVKPRPKSEISRGGTPQASRAAIAKISADRRQPPITLAKMDKVSIWFGASGPAADQVPATGPITIAQAQAHDRRCRWPLWGNERPDPKRAMFCGEPRFDGSYCIHHAAASAGIGSPAERRAHLEAAE